VGGRKEGKEGWKRSIKVEHRKKEGEERSRGITAPAADPSLLAIHG